MLGFVVRHTVPSGMALKPDSIGLPFTYAHLPLLVGGTLKFLRGA